DQKGNNDLLNLTRPELVREIAQSFADAGADILATNSFNANRISQADYGAEHLVHEINAAAARIIRDVADVYVEQIEGLIEGGADIVLIETVFDTLNSKAAIAAARRVSPDLPIMVSMTITDLSGRNLSGHSIEAFWASVRHARPLSIGLNCSFGAGQLRPH